MLFCSSPVPPSLTQSRSPLLFLLPIDRFSFCLCFQPKAQLATRRCLTWSNTAGPRGVASSQFNGQSLDRKLPPDWEEIFSKSTGKTYYYNRCAMFRCGRCVLSFIRPVMRFLLHSIPCTCNLRTQSPVSVLACVLQSVWVFIYILLCSPSFCYQSRPR